MKIYIDTADLGEIKTAYSWGIVDGVTTNPSLIKKAVDSLKGETDMESYIKDILRAAGGDIGRHPVSLEVIGLTEDEMFDQAMRLYEKFNPERQNVVIKIPVNPSPKQEANYDGLKATARLANKGVPVNSTLIMSPEQALLAAHAGARYVSPFAGRIDDYLRKERMEWKLVESEPDFAQFTKTSYYPAEGMPDNVGDHGIVSGVDLVRKIVEILKEGFETEVIAASLRNARQVREVALAGSHIATIPFAVLEEMMVHPKTSEGIQKFSADVVPEYKALFD